MKKLFQRAIAVVLCFALLSNFDFAAFAQEENKEGGLRTVSQNASVSQNDMVTAGDAGQDIDIVVKHYLGEVADENMLFAPKEYSGVKAGERITNVLRENNGFAVERVILYETENGVKIDEGVDVITALEENTLALDLPGDEYVIEVVYRETIGMMENAITIFDYTNGNASNKNSINYTGNYPSTVPYDQRMGTFGAKKDYVTLWSQSDGTNERKFSINEYNRYDYNYKYVTEDEDKSNNKLWKDYRKGYPIIEGLLLGLDGENYSNVNFRFADPGFFSDDGRVGKKIEKGYEFVFARTGMTYELVSVINEEKNVELTDLSNFFPLSVGAAKKNEYFGIRYDFTFKLEDYIGDMTYSFAGDDDVWVCLDGEVMLDLGGIHGVYPTRSDEYNSDATYAPNTVDVWTRILGKDNYTVQDKIAYVSNEENANREYTVTVLYMERGGYESNCYMDFVMPNVVVVEPPIIGTKASLPVYKVDGESKRPISDVEFSLTTADHVVLDTKSTDEKGHLTFYDLTVGTYYLTETKAKPGYLPAGPWEVTVSESRTASTITPYVSKVVSLTGSPVELKKEKNYFVVENTPVKSLVDYDKTATLLNNQDRTYTIDITAQVKEADVTFQNVQVIDYIDPRFEITAESRAVLEAAGAVIGSEDGMETVTWNGLTLTTTPWQGAIIVKAKKDFLGGDEVPTNGPKSKIVINEMDFELPIPTVDVRLLELDITGGETTIFLGEEVTPAIYWQEDVEGTLEAEYTDSKQQSDTFNLPALSEEQWEELFAKGTCTMPYAYGDITFGDLIYKVSGAPLEVHEALAVGSPYETYCFTVTYEAFDRSNGTDTPFGSVSADCEYDVNVIAGTLALKKTIYASDYKAVQGDPVFRFKVMKDGEFFAYSTVRFSEIKVAAHKLADDTVTLEVDLFENLEKGVYTIEELDTLRFTCVKVEASGTAYESSDVKKKSAVFEIGYDEEGNATRTEGKVTFTNRKSKEEYFSHTDVVVNTCSFDNEGNLIWSGDDLTGAQK